MRYFYYLLLMFTIVGCSSASNTTNNPIPEPEQKAYSYLALGDSYTIGESVEPSERWPVQLKERLNERGLAVVAPKIIAKTGWTTGNLLEGMNSELEVQRDFDIVSILIGVNNQYQGRSIDEYEEQLREIFRKAINHSKHMEKGVFAVSIPDYSVTPFGQNNAEQIHKEVDQFNAVFKKVAEDFNVDFYNITPISREAADNPDLIAGDGLHPSGLMYRYWVDEIIDEVAGKIVENQ